MIDISLILVRRQEVKPYPAVFCLNYRKCGSFISRTVQQNKLSCGFYDSYVCRAGVFDAGSEVLIQYHYPFRLQLGTLNARN